MPAPPPLLSLPAPFNHHFSFLIFYYFGFGSSLPRARPLYFAALTGNGFACHVTLVTDCVMDGVLVRAFLCLKGTRRALAYSAASRSTCQAPHPARVGLRRLHRVSKQPCSSSPSASSIFGQYFCLRVCPPENLKDCSATRFLHFIYTPLRNSKAPLHFNIPLSLHCCLWTKTM